MAANYRRESRYTPDEYRQRPRDFDPGLADEILQRVENGETLVAACFERAMPLPATFLTWVDDDPNLAERYEVALRRGTDVVFDEALEAAFDADTHRGSLRHKALMTRAERLMPERYGPRAVLKTGPEKDDATSGIDHQAEVRRKLGAMAKRLAPDAGQDAPTGG